MNPGQKNIIDRGLLKQISKWVCRKGGPEYNIELSYFTEKQRKDLIQQFTNKMKSKESFQLIIKGIK